MSTFLIICYGIFLLGLGLFLIGLIIGVMITFVQSVFNDLLSGRDEANYQRGRRAFEGDLTHDRNVYWLKENRELNVKNLAVIHENNELRKRLYPTKC